MKKHNKKWKIVVNFLKISKEGVKTQKILKLLK